LKGLAVQVWDFKGRALKSRWEVGCSLVKIVYHRLNGSGLLLLKDCSYIHPHTYYFIAPWIIVNDIGLT
jgi:hypothetical protein